MKVMSVNNVQYGTVPSNQKNKKNPNFKHFVCVDVGASSPGGTAKVIIANNAGEILKTFVTKLSSDVSGFLNNSEFISKLHDVIACAHKAARQMSDLYFTSREDKKLLSGFTGFVPGITDSIDIISYLPNLKDKQGNPLRNIDFRDYIDRLKTNKTNIAVDENKFNFIVTKDLNGAGILIAEILKMRDKLKEGFCISPVLCGGGFGAVDLLIKKNTVQILSGEPSNIIVPNHQFKEQLKHMIESGKDPKELLRFIEDATLYSKIGRSTGVKDYIKIYFEKLGHAELAPLAVKAGDARIVNYNEMKVKDNSELVKQLLSESKGLFVLKSEEKGASTLEVNPAMVDPELMQKAKIGAAEAYATGLAEYSILQINRMFNRVILTGPFASGMNDYISANPNLFHATSLPDMITGRINQIIHECDLPTTNFLKGNSKHGFKVICNPAYNLKDNAAAGPIALKPGVHFTEHRGNDIELPFNVL